MKNQILLALSLAFLVGVVNITAQENNDSLAIKGGGVSAKGWTGKIDAKRINASLVGLAFLCGACVGRWLLRRTRGRKPSPYYNPREFRLPPDDSTSSRRRR